MNVLRLGLISALVSTMLLGSGSYLQAQGLKIAVVDMRELFSAHPDSAAAEKRMDKIRTDNRTKFKAASGKLKDTLASYNSVASAIRRGGTEAATGPKKKQADELADKAKQLEREVAELQSRLQTELEHKILIERRKILDKINVVIREFNVNAGYALVLDKSATSANGIHSVVDAPGAADITKEIAALLK